MDKFIKKWKEKESSQGENSSSPHNDPTIQTLEGVSTLNQSNTKAGNRRFNPEWCKSFPWLIFSESKNVVHCSICKQIAEHKGFQFSSKREPTFVDTGFSNWKKALEKFKVHERSGCHQEAVVKVHSLKAGVNVSGQLVDSHQKQMTANRIGLLKLFSSLRFLATQGLAIRGHTDSDSNFTNLLRLRSEDSAELNAWLKRDKYSWCSHDVQNEMLDLMSHTLLRKLLEEVKNATYYAIICDETADVSRKEQMSITFRFVNDSLEIGEHFVGFYVTDSTDSTTVYKILLDVITRFEMLISNMRGQGYDGAANMAGIYNGVQAKIRDVEKKAIFVHCLAHSLNLAVQDVIKQNPKCRDTLDMVKDLINFVRDSPKRMVFFQQLKNEDTTSLRPLCPTRWSVRYKSIASIISNYEELLTFFSSIASNDSSVVGSKASGFLRLMYSFDFYFVLNVLAKLFGQIDTVSTALQQKSLHLEHGHRMVATLKQSIQFEQGHFNEVWKKVIESKPTEVTSPVMPRKRRVPERYDYDDTTDRASDQCDSIEKQYESLYVEIIGLVVSVLTTRFETDSFKFVLEIEQFLLGSDRDKNNILQFYDGDIDPDRLILHRDMYLQILESGGKRIDSLDDMVKHLKDEKHLLFMVPELVKFLRIVLTIPVSTATAERSFSGLKRIKSYLRSTMGQQRVNSVCILNFHREIANQLDVDKLADEFICRNELRRRTFSLNTEK